MAQLSQKDLERPTGKAHPFGVTVDKELKATNKCASTSKATGFRHGSNVTNSSSNNSTHFLKSYGRDVSIAVLFAISLATSTVVIWHTIQTEGVVNRLQTKNDELREVILLVVVKTEQIEKNDKNQDLLIATSTNQTDVALTLAALAVKDKELQITDDALLNDVKNITQNLVDVTETLTVLSKNITVLEASSEVVQNLTRKVQDTDPRETSIGPLVLAKGEERALFHVTCTGTYFFHIVTIFQSAIESQLDFTLYIGFFFKTVVTATSPGETFVRAYTKQLEANDYVRILNVGDKDSHIAELIINSHLIGICQ